MHQARALRSASRIDRTYCICGPGDAALILDVWGCTWRASSQNTHGILRTTSGSWKPSTNVAGSPAGGEDTEAMSKRLVIIIIRMNTTQGWSPPDSPKGSSVARGQPWRLKRRPWLPRFSLGRHCHALCAVACNHLHIKLNSCLALPLSSPASWVTRFRCDKDFPMVPFPSVLRRCPSPAGHVGGTPLQAQRVSPR